MEKIKPIITNLTWALGLLFLIQSHAGTSCENLLKIHLQDSQRELLIQAKNNYQVEILTGLIADRERTIVFLGETDLKDSKQAIAKQFYFRGFEGVRADQTWGGKILVRSLDLIYEFAPTTSLKEQDQADTDNDPEETELSAKLKTKPIINVQLQAGHRLGLAENLQSVLFPVSVLFGVGALGVAALDWPFPGNAISAATGNMTIHILALAGTQLVFKTISDRLRNTSLLFQSYVYRGRNRTMVKNIAAAFQRHQDQNIILVLVSRPHIPGMKEILKNRFGFQEQILTN